MNATSRFASLTAGEIGATSGTIKQQWADYYALRNHLIHGGDVPAREFSFRGKQRHLAAAPTIFAGTLFRLMDEARRRVKQESPFATEVLRWEKWTDIHDLPERKYEGFAIDRDWEAVVAKHWAIVRGHR